MIKEEISVNKEGSRKKGNGAYKLETALAWVSCMQRGKSPIDRLKEQEIEQIIIYGTTELGELLVEEAQQKNYKILAITDRAVREGGYEYQGISVIKRKDIEKYRDEVIVVTSMTFWEEIKDELHTEGCSRVIALRELM